MTTTPHKGDPQHFALFLQLLDKDVYGDVASLQEAMKRNEAPFYLCRIKEALVTFPDAETGEVKKLFTKRNVRTVDFQIDDEEWEFYDALTQFVEEQSIRAAEEGTAQGRAVGFTMAMLQRRFASSLYAVRRTLERMKNRREKILADPEKYYQEQIARRIPEDFDELPEEEQAAILEELENSVLSVDPQALQEEILQLGKLITQAQYLEMREVESKLLKLKETITQEGIFADRRMKLLIFTEHKDTLDYLAGDGKDGRSLGKLREWGLTVTQIHGGMKIGDRDTPSSRIRAEHEFRETCQVMVATEAAGEGINLQFCWFMINYDIPWNPVRLEQRMGRIHRYGQENDCLIVNFVATNTREGRVLQKLFERVRQIERDLDPDHVGTVFNVLGDIFPSNQLERLIREMYARNQTEDRIKERIVAEVDVDRFRHITQSALEGLAKRELNLSSVLAKSAEARERRLVPEVIEDFFLQAAPFTGFIPKPVRGHQQVYHIGRLPRALHTYGSQQEPRFGPLAREYKDITFRRETLQQDATLEWVTPGHPLFEAVRADMAQQSQADLERGALFYDLNQAKPSCLDLFVVRIQDGRGRPLRERLFVVETQLDGTTAVRQPTLFLDLIPTPSGIRLPEQTQSPNRQQAEQHLIQEQLQTFLAEVQTEREQEVETVSRHVEISLKELIDRQNWKLAELLLRQQAGEEDPLLPANIKRETDRLDELEARRDRRRAELQQERHCTIGHIRHIGRSWILPHPNRDQLNMAPMVRDELIEKIAIAEAIHHETARGWVVEDVQRDNKGFDLISRHPQNANELRFIEVKGRARVGIVSLSNNEYNTAYRLKADYWLYVVYNCAATPELYAIQDPARLRWEPMQEVIQYRVDAETVLDAATAQHSRPLNEVAQAFQAAWYGRLADIGKYNILVEGLSDKVYLELAAQKLHQSQGINLLQGGQVRIIAGRGTKKFAPDFGLLQSLEGQGIRFVVMLDGDEPGAVAAEAMQRFGAQKNRHFFHLERPDYKDKSGKSWDVEIEDMLPWSLLETYITQHPEAIEERFQRSGIQKVVILGKPVERNGQTFDYKMMLTEFVKQTAVLEDLLPFVTLLHKARKCMGL